MGTRERILQELWGKTVHVEVDRPIGYQHGDIVYPINYGYLPGVIAGDGEEQDAYILGVSKPISSFDGRVIGVIHRRNDTEDKLVVAPEGSYYHQAEIAEAVQFQEQFFDDYIDSMLQKSCGIIPFRRNGGENEFLILLQTNHFWSFPKGHMEAGETETETALRELLEETGLTATLIQDARVISEYDMPTLRRKQLVLFLGEVNGTVTPQKGEIRNYRWVKARELKDYLHPNTYEACMRLIGGLKE